MVKRTYGVPPPPFPPAPPNPHRGRAPISTVQPEPADVGCRTNGEIAGGDGAYAFVGAMVKHADIKEPFPAWHGWALREAFAAGWTAALKTQLSPIDPMDWPLPCAVTVGGGTMHKGVKLRTLVARMKVLYEMATGYNADEVANRTPEQRKALADAFVASVQEAWHETQEPVPQQEPTSVDLKTMETAESVGLIGPASRSHDLHAAIQRFHDLICANATIKAAQMAAEAISEAAPQPAAQEPSPTAGMNIAQRILHVGGRNPTGSTYVEFGSIQAVEALVKQALRDLQPAPAAQGDALDAARWRWLSEHIQVAWNEGKFTSLVRIVSEQHRQSLNASVDRMMAGDWSDAARAAQEGK